MAVDETPLSVKETLANEKKRRQLESHIDGRHRAQEVVNQSKAGQIPAEQVILGPQVNGQKAELPTEVEARTKALTALVELTKYDDASKEDVVNLAKQGTDLTDPQMWNVVAGNARFMTTNIGKDLVVNKILPDETIDNVVQHKQTWVQKDSNGTVTASSTQLGGSVADQRYYERLTGEQAIANFGLDYGGYSPGTLKSDQRTAGDGGNPSSYVAQTTPDEAGRGLTAVPNVFYVKVKVPEASLDQIKVPVHPNVSKWATEKLKEVNQALSEPQTIKTLAAEAGGTEKEMIAKLQEKKATLETFAKHSKVDEWMSTTVTPDGSGGFVKNKEDPLTNLGMTKPSNRLQTDFETINQEYHIGNRFNVPEGSELFVKDASGTDVSVGQFKNNKFENLNTTLIAEKMEANKVARALAVSELTASQLKASEQAKLIDPQGVQAKANLKTPTTSGEKPAPRILSDLERTKANLNKAPEKTVEPAPKVESDIEQAMAKLKKAPLQTGDQNTPKAPSELEQARGKLKPVSVKEQLAKTSTSVKPKVEGESVSPKGQGHKF